MAVSPAPTSTVHKQPYAAIDPARPELSQKGRVVLVTGSSSGIGFAIARSFAKAQAAVVILTGRQQASLSKAVDILKLQFPNTQFIGKGIDIADSDAVGLLWDQLDAEDLVVDVLILNAARIQPKVASMLDLGYEEVVADFATNVGGNMKLTDCFYHQRKRDKAKRLSLLNVSTMAIHDFEVASGMPNYSASKNAGTIVVQQIARGVAPSDMQVISFHPGSILTTAAQKSGHTEMSRPWDNGK
ncbi:hypothetical protein J3459_016695 [Metarhizium acridum]|uniref:uncharacterized protein n=1 Tax=Metarhizium acridum TaxID=92637 RepID=UPI001C6C4B2E|nr:hypothetical protein J3459_016695 [Metarhizium acridum]KAG8410809.1 hypothetical protein J3458_016897 [Metarhizium acridum]